MSGFSAAPTQATHPGYVSGRWYFCMQGTASSAITTGADTIRLTPFILTKPITVSQLGARVGTLSVGGFFQIALYASDPTTKMPTGLSLTSTANMSTTTAVVVTANVTDVVLVPGLYWAAVNNNNATSVIQSLSTALQISSWLIGSATATDLTSATANTSFYFTVAQAFGTWPDLTAVSPTLSAANNGPQIMMQAA